MDFLGGIEYLKSKIFDSKGGINYFEDIGISLVKYDKIALISLLKPGVSIPVT